MVAERPKQSVQAFFNSNVKPFFDNKSPTLTDNQKRLCEELESIVYWEKPSSDNDGPNQVDSDCRVTGRLQNFLDDNNGNRDLKFVLGLKRGKEGSTVLHDVADWNAEAVDLLLKAGADSSIHNNEGKTPLQVAIHNRCYSAVGVFSDDELKRLPDKQKELNEEFLKLFDNINYTSSREKFDSEYDINNGSFGELEKFIDYHTRKNHKALKAVLNLRRGEYGSTILHNMNNFFYDETLNLLLKAGADPNIQDVDGKTPLHRAAEYNCIEITKSLLDSKKVDINIQDRDGKSAIECVIDSAYEDYANIYYYPQIIELLVEAGADPNAQSQGKTVLEVIIAATEGFNKEECIKVAKLLIKKGVDINLKDNLFGRTLLHHAAANGRENIVELLLQSTEGEKRTQLINAQDNNGNTPLHCAVENAGYSNVVELLLAYGADYKIVNRRSLLSRIKGEDTPLHVASQKSDRRNIEPFFGKVDINITNGDGATPLLIASRFGSAVIIESFLEHGADAKAKDKHKNTALHYAANHERTNNDEECNQLFDESNKYRPEADNEVEDNEKIIQSLIEKGVDVNDKNEYGHTPLFFAIEHRKYSNIKLLLKSGTDVNIADENGFTVFHFAIRQTSFKMLKILLPKKTIKENENCSAINDENDSSIEEVDTEEAKKLLSVTDNEGNTLLHHAIKWGCDEEILSFLIKHGVDINKKNNYGIAPIHIAAKYGDLSQINFLINRGADLNVRCDIISRSVINNIGREKELSDDSTDTYIHIQDNTVDVNNT